MVVHHFQPLAGRCMPAILPSAFALRRLLPRACAIAACMRPGNRGRWVAREERRQRCLMPVLCAL